jgi:hypothetical protein
VRAPSHVTHVYPYSLTFLFCILYVQIDIAFQNVSGVGMTYGTSLFVSKSQAQYTSPYGFSNNSALGAFSTHASTGCINPTYGCVNSPQDAGSCPAAPLDFGAESTAARTAGVKAGTAGGGCPIYTDDMAKSVRSRVPACQFCVLSKSDPFAPSHFHLVQQLQAGVDAHVARVDGERARDEK